LAWAVKVTEEYATWFTALIKEDLGSAVQVAQAVAALREEGPTLGRAPAPGSRRLDLVADFGDRTPARHRHHHQRSRLAGLNATDSAQGRRDCRGPLQAGMAS